MTPNTQQIHRALLLCELVCAHYGMTEEATKQARESARLTPHHAGECYGAVLESLGHLKCKSYGGGSLRSDICINCGGTLSAHLSLFDASSSDRP